MAWQRQPNGIWQRPLATNELRFALDGLHHGVAKNCSRVTCTGAPHLFEKATVVAAWARACRRHPLLAGRVDLGDRTAGSWTVDEQHLQGIARDGDVVFWTGAADDLHDHLVSGPDTLLDCTESVAKLFIAPSSMKNAVDVFVYLDHSIGDFASLLNAQRTFFEELTSPTNLENLLDLPTCFARCASPDAFPAPARMSRARQRWRWAAAKVILSLRRPPSGGLDLPAVREENVGDTPVTRSLHRKLNVKITAQLLSCAKASAIPVHHHFMVASIIALVRTLHRLRVEGKLDTEELQRLLMQPSIGLGILNLRSFIGYDTDAVACVIAFYTATLPAIAPRTASTPPAEVPSYNAICSHERYLRLVKIGLAKYKAVIDHPLRDEFMAITNEAILRARPAYPVKGSPSTTVKIPNLAFRGGSLGKMDAKLPAKWPGGLKLQYYGEMGGLRSRPSELYVACRTWQDQLIVTGTVDTATYQQGVDVYFDEVVESLKHYLSPTAFALGKSDTRAS